jgi:hypothetical protein
MYFLEAQGYPAKPIKGVKSGITIHQDNMSTMLLAKNGRASSSKRTRHINIRYYFITDRIGRHEVQVKYCPTDDMIADFYTKPLNGGKFRKFRNLIMNCDYDDDNYDRNLESDSPNMIRAPKVVNNDDSTRPVSYKDVLCGSQECVGASRASQVSMTRDGRTLWPREPRLSQPANSSISMNKRVRFRSATGTATLNQRRRANE